MANPVVHFEIGCRDNQKTQDFYSALFGWKIAQAGPAAMIDTGHPVTGHISALGHEPFHYTIFYVEVDDVQAYLDKAAKLGGKDSRSTGPNSHRHLRLDARSGRKHSRPLEARRKISAAKSGSAEACFRLWRRGLPPANPFHTWRRSRRSGQPPSAPSRSLRRQLEKARRAIRHRRTSSPNGDARCTVPASTDGRPRFRARATQRLPPRDRAAIHVPARRIQARQLDHLRACAANAWFRSITSI